MAAQLPTTMPIDAIADEADDEELQRRRERIEEAVTAIAATCVVLLISIYSAVASLS
jgi:hypothetical protein